MNGSVINALTVDVEDAINLAMRNYFHVDIKPTDRVINNTMRLLDLFSEYRVLGTFFVLGEVAETFPGLIKEIAARGHELGIHGYSHFKYYSLSKEKAREEIIKSKNILEDITGQIVIGHRAPEFSVNQKTNWVLELLIEAGIKYDSSIFPTDFARYGWPGFNKDIGLFKLNDGRQIIEAPLSVVNVFGKDIPSCGGSYLRILPYFTTKYAFKKIVNYRPVVAYLHPYEIDQPPFQKFYMDKIQQSSLKRRVQLSIYWYNRKSVVPKIKRMLQTYHFSTLGSVINEHFTTNI